MSGKMIARPVLMAVACLLAAQFAAQAEPVCNGTIVVASSETTTTGSVCANNYLATQSSDNVRECLQEGGTLTKLNHTWHFVNVPAGHLSLIYEGNRSNNADGDNFKFSGIYDDGGGATGVIMSAVINSALELQGGFQYDMGVDTSGTATFDLTIKDSAGGSNVDSVNIDYLAICSEPME